jgi:cell division protein FtsB
MNSQPQQPQFTIAELGAKFGTHLAQILSELITFEKVIEMQQAQIEAIALKETRLTDHIQDLEDELTLLRSENFELQQVAKAGNAIIAAANDKAAPIEAA